MDIVTTIIEFFSKLIELLLLLNKKLFGPKKSVTIFILLILVCLVTLPILLDIIIKIFNINLSIYDFVSKKNYLKIIYSANILVLVAGICVLFTYLKHNARKLNEKLARLLNQYLGQEKFQVFAQDGHKLKNISEFGILCNSVFVKNLMLMYATVIVLYIYLLTLSIESCPNILQFKSSSFNSILLNAINIIAVFFILSMSLIFSNYNKNIDEFKKNVKSRRRVILIVILFSIPLHYVVLKYKPEYGLYYMYLSGLCVGASFNFLISRLYSPYISANGFFILFMILYGTMQTGLVHIKGSEIDVFRITFFTITLILKIIFMFYFYVLIRSGKLITHIILTNSIDNQLQGDVKMLCEIVDTQLKSKS